MLKKKKGLCGLFMRKLFSPQPLISGHKNENASGVKHTTKAPLVVNVLRSVAERCSATNWFTTSVSLVTRIGSVNTQRNVTERARPRGYDLLRSHRAATLSPLLQFFVLTLQSGRGRFASDHSRQAAYVGEMGDKATKTTSTKRRARLHQSKKKVTNCRQRFQKAIRWRQLSTKKDLGSQIPVNPPRTEKRTTVK